MSRWRRCCCCVRTACWGGDDGVSILVARAGRHAAAAVDAALRHAGDRGADLRDGSDGLQPAARLHRAAVVRPGHFLRPGQLFAGPGADPHRAAGADFAGAGDRHRRGGGGAGRLVLDPAARHLLRDADAGVLADVLFPGLFGAVADRRRQRPARHPAPRAVDRRARAGLAGLAVAVLRLRRGAVPGGVLPGAARHRFGVRPHAAGNPRQRGAGAGGWLQHQGVQAAGLRDLGRGDRARRRPACDADRHRAAGQY